MNERQLIATAPREPLDSAANRAASRAGRIEHQVFGWPMLDIQRLTQPVPARGAQDLWTWTGQEITHA